MTPNETQSDTNTVSISPNDLNEFREDIEELVKLTTIMEAAKEDLNERAKEVQEKYSESESLGMKAAQYKKMASMIVKDNAQEERKKSEEIFDLLDHVKS